MMRAYTIWCCGVLVRAVVGIVSLMPRSSADQRTIVPWGRVERCPVIVGQPSATSASDCGQGRRAPPAASKSL